MDISSAVSVQDSGVQDSGVQVLENQLSEARDSGVQNPDGIRQNLSRQSFLRQTDDELLSQVRGAAAREREATEVVLRTLLEVERRKLYLKRGFPSLFDFCVQELGYCAGSAHLRIQSMRLLREVSEEKRVEIGEKLASGRLTLSQLSNLQTYSRQAYPRRVEPERKLEILARVEGESTRSSQKIILEELGMQVAALERMRIRGPDQVELTVTLTGEAVELLEEWKALTSHSNPEGRNGEAILAALRVAVEQGRKRKGGGSVRESVARGEAATGGPKLDLQGVRRGVTEEEGEEANWETGAARDRSGVGQDRAGASEPPPALRSLESGGVAERAPALPSRASARAESVVNPARYSLHAHEVGRSRSVGFGGMHQREVPSGGAGHPVLAVPGPASPSAIPSAIRRLVWHRDGGQCTFRDHRSGRRCQGRRYLEMDHIRPRADGGPHELANLRLLCGAHHRMRHEGS